MYSRPDAPSALNLQCYSTADSSSTQTFPPPLARSSHWPQTSPAVPAMSSAFEDEDLSLSISTSAARRTSNRQRPSATPNGSRPPARADSTSITKVNQRLGQYQIVKTLGEGSFGKVKLAVHAVSGQRVALKIIARKKLITRDMAGRIEREIQYLQLLRHPHIIKLYTVITTPSEIIMVLEYAGIELFDHIVAHGSMNQDKARKFFQQIVCAVEYCHRHKIVHRDLKPENLLLDENLNVKIADFGLSNIMTDGNFLKTSCGSPNYAAPEVISGKLYAGPEVDVWSCGVILYVLLVGRLPFDDDYIPALFKKIAQGSYTVPPCLPSGATRLIGKMLVVNPVHRITIGEIRQDRWFNVDLAPYLQLPAEEFFDTGVDPTKAIDPNKLGPARPSPVVQQLHDTVVGKLGKTMGYAREDVQEALAKDEPSAIKDAYLIVRENQIMRTNPLLSQEVSLQPFLATSPPNYESRSLASPLGRQLGAQPAMNTERQRHGSNASNATIGPEHRSTASTIAVLPSSLPDFHRAYMKGHPKPNASPERTGSASPAEQSARDQVTTPRRLKPHARSRADVDRSALRPEALTPISEGQRKKSSNSKPIKWQFGIRSRNQPAEAMLAIYKALRAMGADWEVATIRRPGRANSSGDESPGRGASGSRGGSTDSLVERLREGANLDSASDVVDPADEPSSSSGINNGLRAEDPPPPPPSPRERGRPRKAHGPWDDFGYRIPEDPWVINARFRKDGMYPPGVQHPSSTHSSRADLHDYVQARSRSRSSSLATTSIHHDDQSHHGSVPAGSSSRETSAAASIAGEVGRWPEPDDACYVCITIQLYHIEPGFFLVDFKCAGYERLIPHVVREVQIHSQDGQEEWRKLGDGEEADGGLVEKPSVRQRLEVVGAGRAVDEKRATSPFPFLDVASKLIIQLAQTND